MAVGDHLRDYQQTLLGVITAVHADGTFDYRTLFGATRFNERLCMGDKTEHRGFQEKG